MALSQQQQCNSIKDREIRDRLRQRETETDRETDRETERQRQRETTERYSM